MSSEASAPSAVIPPQILSPVFSAYPDAKRWFVAYSGGVDSHVLLLLCQRYLDQIENPPALIALHVNHQLQDQADDWQLHCQHQSEQLGVTFIAEKVSVCCEARQSLEEQARLARYSCFEQHLQEGDLLLMGHHQDDQAETLMLRLLRGSGAKGLRAMSVSRPLAKGFLCRPLLTTSRQQIEQFAQQAQLSWVEDPSNQQQHFDRNFLRSQCLPVIEQQWPGYRQTLTRAANLSDESQQLNEALAELDLERLGCHCHDVSLPLAALNELSPVRQKNVLRFWLERRGLPMASAGQMAQILSSVIAAADDANPLVSWRGVEVRRFAGRLYALTAQAPVDVDESWPIGDAEQLVIPGVGCLRFARRLGEGVRCDARLRVGFRQGGERIRPAGRTGSRLLKKLFQDLSVPPWWRHRLPLIKAGDELVAVADLVTDQAWQVKPEEQGLVIEWLPEGEDWFEG